MRKLLILLVVVAILGGGAYYALAVYPDQRLKSAFDQSIRSLPPGYVVSYQSVHYSMLSNHGTVGDVSIRQAAMPDVTVSIDEITVDGPDWGFPDAWSKAAANPAAVSPEVAVPLAATVIVTGVAFHTPQVSGTLGSMRIDGPRAYPWALLHPGVPTLAEAQAAVMAAPQPPTPADLLPLLKLEAAYILGTGEDHYVVQSLSATGTTPATDKMPATPFTYTIGRLEASTIDRGSIKEAGGEAFAFDMGALGSARIDRLTLTGIDARQPMTRVLAGDPATPEMLDGMALGKIEYSGITVHPPVGKDVSLGAFSISNIAVAQAVPVSAGLTMTSLRLSRDQMPDDQSKEAFDQLGLESATVSFGVAYDWDVAKQHLSVHDTAVKVDELGALDLSADATDVDPKGDWAIQGKFSHGLIHYKDASLVDRAFKYGAAKQNTDPAKLRQQIIELIKQASAAFASQSPAIGAASNALVTFLKTPKSLTVELSPPQPVPFTSLEGAAGTPPAELAASLGITVSANQPVP